MPVILAERTAVEGPGASAGEIGGFPMDVHYFPHPTVQAMFLLDEAENDLETATELALMNAQKENLGDVRYWVAVVDALSVKGQLN